MIEIRPIVQATGPDNPAKQISVTNWNIGHALTAAPFSLIGTDGTGASIEYPVADFATDQELADAIAALPPPPDLTIYATDADLAAGLATKADVDHTHANFTSVAAGFTPASGGGTVNFLRADGSWAAPAGGGGGDAAWGSITGDIYFQEDLIALLDTKANLAGGNDITGDQSITGDLLLDGDGQVAAGHSFDILGGAMRITTDYENAALTLVAGAAAGDLILDFHSTSGSALSTGWVGFGHADATRMSLSNALGAIGIQPSGSPTTVFSSSGTTSTVAITVPDETYGAGWNGDLSVPTKKALYDKIQTLGAGGGSISDGAYPTGWDGDTTGGASRNAIYDKLAAMDTTISGKAPLVHTHVISDVTGLTAALDAKADDSDLASYIPLAQKGAASGVVPLNGSTKIDATYLPSYVDDVLEFANLAAFPATGETGKIYVALDTGKTYRWTGSAYAEISSSAPAAWGTITGTLADQTDLQTALNAKVDKTVAGTNTVQATGTAAKVVLDQAGGTYGSTKLSVLSESGTHGALFQSLSLDLVDFAFLAPSGQRNIRFELRPGNTAPPNTWEFQFGLAGTPEFRIGGSLVWSAVPISVPDDPYAAGWDASLQVPTKNAIYDKIQAVVATIPAAGIPDGDKGDVLVASSGASMTVQGASGPVFTVSGTGAAEIDFVADGSPVGYFLADSAGFYALGATYFKVLDAATEDTWATIDATGINIPTGATYKINGVAIGGGGGGLTDGDYGDVLVGSGGTTMTVQTVGGATIATVSQLANYLPLTGGTLSGNLSVTDEAYGAGWDGKLEVPTKNAVYDKIQTVIGTIPGTGVTTFNTRSGAVTLTVADVTAAFPALTGDVTTTAGAVATTIAANAVTWAKLQKSTAGNTMIANATATSVANFAEIAIIAGTLLGRGPSGNIASLTVGATLAQTNTTIGVAKVPNAATFQATGGAAAGTTFDGSAARVIDYSTVGAQVAGSYAALSHTHVPADILTVPTGTVFYRKTASTGAAETQTLATLKTDLAIAADIAASVSDTAYAAGWNGVTGVSPSQNAVYDKIETVVTSIAAKADTSALANYLPLTGGTLTGALLATGTTVTRIETGGSSVPGASAGVGLELYVTAGAGRLQSYNRTSSGFAPLEITGSNFDLNSTGLAVTGNISATGTVGTGNGVISVSPGPGYLYSALQMRGSGGVAAYGLDITAGNTNAYFSADNFIFRNAATTTTYATLGATGLAVTGTVTVTDDAYAAGWDGSFAVPTKNAIYDKIQAVIGTIPAAGVTTFNTRSGAVTLTATDVTNAMPAFTGDVTNPAGSVVNTIANGAVSLAKMANLTATSLIGNNTGSPATPVACTLGATLAFSGAALGVTKVPQSNTFNNGGAGDASGTTFDGSVARTTSWNTIGAQPDNPRVQTVSSNATVTPTFANDLVEVTAQAVNLAVASPTGTAVNGKKLMIRIKAAAGSLTLTMNAVFRAVGVTFPATLTNAKWLYLGCVYNTNDTKWDVVALAQEA